MWKLLVKKIAEVYENSANKLFTKKDDGGRKGEERLTLKLKFDVLFYIISFYSDFFPW